MWQTLAQYAPQKMFIVQGGEEVFDALVGEYAVHEPMTQALSVPRFTIDHARTLATFAIEGTGSTRTCIVYFAVFSPDAAQVLLKSLEEPDPNTSIIFITPHPYTIPQTVRSRVIVITDHEVYKPRALVAILSAVTKEAESKDDDASVRRARALILLDELERALKGDANKAKTLYEAKEMLYRANMPTKFVLDYVATMVK